MKKHLLLGLSLAVLLMSMGCSKKDEECAAVMPISDAYLKSFDEIQTGSYSLKEVATIRQVSLSVQQKARKLSELKLTDEQLVALKTSTVKQYEQASAMLNEMTEAFSAASDAAGPKEKAASEFEGARTGVKDACEKKEKKRRKRKKKKKECKIVDAELAGLPATGLTEEKMLAAIDALGGLKISFDDVKAAMDKVIGNLKAQIEGAKVFAEAQKKADASKKRLEEQKKQNAEGAKKLKTYCTPG